MANRSAARSPFIFLLAIAFLAGQWGCAHTTPIPDSIPVYSVFEKSLPVKLGRIGIVSSRTQPEMNFKKPKEKLGGAATGAGRGAVTGGAVVASAGAPSGGSGGGGYGGIVYPIVWLAAVAASTGIGAFVGGVVGAIQGESSGTIRETEATLNEALTELRIQEIMRDLIYQKANEKGLYSLVLIEDMGPTAPDESADYFSLKGRGINTVLEVEVLRIGLWGEAGINPPLTFFMTANAKYIRVNDNYALDDRTFRFEGASRKFAEWGLNDGEAFRKEFEEGCHFLAREIAEQLGSR